MFSFLFKQGSMNKLIPPKLKSFYSVFIFLHKFIYVSFQAVFSQLFLLMSHMSQLPLKLCMMLPVLMSKLIVFFSCCSSLYSLFYIFIYISDIYLCLISNCILSIISFDESYVTASANAVYDAASVSVRISNVFFILYLLM